MTIGCGISTNLMVSKLYHYKDEIINSNPVKDSCLKGYRIISLIVTSVFDKNKTLSNNILK